MLHLAVRDTAERRANIAPREVGQRVVKLQASVGYRLQASHDGKLREAIQSTQPTRVKMLTRVEILHFGAQLRAKHGSIEPADDMHGGALAADPAPQSVNPLANRGYRSDASNHDLMFHWLPGMAGQAPH
jgi:hypothetical protein